MDEKQMPFLMHLEELRRALIKCFVAFLVGTGLCLGFSPQIYTCLKKPLQEVLPQGAHFIATTPFESYAAYFKIAAVFGLFLATPWMFYFLWRFIRPGLKKEERRGIVPIALFCALLFTGGALFGYFFVFPAGFRFAVDILEGTDILLLPGMSDYLSFALRMLLAFGIIFELPLFLLLLGKFRVVNAQKLSKARKYVVVVIFLVAGILTPGPDVLSQVLMAIPLLFLYEVGIILVRIFAPKPKLLQITE